MTVMYLDMTKEFKNASISVLWMAQMKGMRFVVKWLYLKALKLAPKRVHKRARRLHMMMEHKKMNLNAKWLHLNFEVEYKVGSEESYEEGDEDGSMVGMSEGNELG